MKKRNQGFTLVELIVVIAILAILAAAAIAGFGQITKQARASRVKTNAETIIKSIANYNTSAETLVDATNLASQLGGNDSTGTAVTATTYAFGCSAADSSTGLAIDLPVECRKIGEATAAGQFVGFDAAGVAGFDERSFDAWVTAGAKVTDAGATGVTSGIGGGTVSNI